MTCNRFSKEVVLKVYFIEVYLICSVALTSAVKQSNSVAHMHTSFFIFFFQYGLLQDSEYSPLCYIRQDTCFFMEVIGFVMEIS